MAHSGVIPGSNFLDTNESRAVFSRHVEHRSLIFDHPPPWGEVYTCPRCGWKSRGMKHRIGAEWQGEKHALICPSQEPRPALRRPSAGLRATAPPEFS